MTIDRSLNENDDGPPRNPPPSQIGHNSRIVAPVLERRLAELKFMPGNPRVHTKAQLRKLDLNLRTYGFVGVIIIDKDDFIVAGEAIAKAARTVGYDRVPTICLTHLTDLQVKAFRIAHNRLAELSRWDDQALGEQLKILMDVPNEIVIETLGFELPEIDFRIESLSAAAAAKEDPADHIPLQLSGPAVTQLNDVWLAGRHKILCGNAVDPSSFARLMPGELATIVLSDPPWNLPNDGFTGGLGKIHHADFMMAAGEMSDAEFAGFLIAMLQLMMLHSTDGAASPSHARISRRIHPRADLIAGRRYQPKGFPCAASAPVGVSRTGHSARDHERTSATRTDSSAVARPRNSRRLGRSKRYVWNSLITRKIPLHGEFWPLFDEVNSLIINCPRHSEMLLTPCKLADILSPPHITHQLAILIPCKIP